MNYKRIHDSIIEKAKNRIIKGYKERHHIIPRCLGGTDEQENLVDLTAREHFVVHQLLVKMYPKEFSLAHAAYNMTISTTRHNRNNNRLYEWLRIKHSKSVSFRQRGQKYYHDPINDKVIRIDSHMKPPEGFIKGRGFSPTKGKFGRSNDSSAFKEYSLQKSLVKRRWDNFYKNIEIYNDMSLYDIGIECIKSSLNNQLNVVLEKFKISSNTYRTILKKKELPTSKYKQSLFLSFGTINEHEIKNTLIKKYDFNRKRKPYKRIIKDYPLMSNHILNRVWSAI